MNTYFDIKKISNNHGEYHKVQIHQDDIKLNKENITKYECIKRYQTKHVEYHKVRVHQEDIKLNRQKGKEISAIHTLTTVAESNAETHIDSQAEIALVAWNKSLNKTQYCSNGSGGVG